MDRKKFILLSTSFLLAASTLTACSGINKKVTFNDYWKADSITKQENLTEELEYAVEFEKSNGLSNYEANYLNGTYKTKLFTETYENRIIYVYETKLDIDVTYQYNGETSDPLHDSVTSVVRFEQSSDSLRPIKAEKTVVSHSPANSDVSSLEECYYLYEYTSTIDYVAKTSVIVHKAKEGEEERKIESDVSWNSDYTPLDNDQLLFAARGLTQSRNSSVTFSLYSPFVKKAQKVKMTFAAEEGSDFTFVQNGTELKTAIQYYPLSIVLNEANPGQTQTAWVAKTTDPSNNKYRNVVLRHSVPLAYGIGTLTYQLTSATFSNI